MAATMVSQAYGRFAYALVLPSVQRDLDITYTLAGTLGTLNLLAYLLASFGVAWLSTRMTPDRIMRFGIWICAVGLAGMWWSPNLLVVVAAMVVTGAGGATIWIPAPAVSSSLVPPHRRAFAIGTVGTGIGLGFVSAGWVARVVGDDWRAVYGFETVVALVTAAMLWYWLRIPAEPATRRPSLRALGHVPHWRTIFATYGGFGLSMSLFVNFMVARLEEDSGFPSARAALVFAVFGVASIPGGPLFGAFSDRAGRRMALILGYVSMVAACLVLLVGSGPWPWLAAVVFGLAFTGIPATTAAYLRDHLSATEFGSAFGVITLAFGAGQLLGPQIGGFVGDRFGSFATAFFVASSVALAAAIASGGLSSAARPGLARPPPSPD
jgi:predicted MFS family arabinose efflux permease